MTSTRLESAFFALASLTTLTSLAVALAACSGAGGTEDLTGQTESASSTGSLRGVDSASAFSDAAARKLKDDFGVKWTGVYIGGPCSAGSGWTKDRVKAIHQATAWSFLPIFVGQESPSICHAHDLTEARGEDDGSEAVALMKDFGWPERKGIPVVLDVEEGTYADDPAATVAYVRGWIERVKADGYKAYVYTSPVATDAFARDHLAIDAIWVASDFFAGFANVTPYSSDLEDQIGRSFHDHDRAWQYAGAAPPVHIDGVGDVDCDVADMPLAPVPE
jgi:hypothetical protein